MKALAGRRVVVTRPAEQARTAMDMITSFGAIPVEVPLIEIVEDPVGASELAALRVAEFDWIVVTSPNGARRVAPLLQARAAMPRLAAVGTATADALPRCDLVADIQSAAGLVEVFPSGSGRVVVVQGLDAAPTMVDGLAERGWQVREIKPFRAVTTAPSDEQRRNALAADAVLFASGSAARAWVEIFGSATPAVSVAIGEHTATAAAIAGLKISVVSADHSMYGMLVALERYLRECN